jgi:hypothetical protein
MKILMKWFAINGKGSFPDTPSLFDPLQDVTYLGTRYWYTDYTGVKDLQDGPSDGAAYAAYLVSLPAVTNIRTISAASLYKRFTSAERQNIRLLAYGKPPKWNMDGTILEQAIEHDPKVIDFYEYFKHFLVMVPLDSPTVTTALAHLVDVGALYVGRPAELLVDVISSEEPITDDDIRNAKSQKVK